MQFQPIQFQDGTKGFRHIANGDTARLCDQAGFTVPPTSYSELPEPALTEAQFMQSIAQYIQANPELAVPPAAVE